MPAGRSATGDALNLIGDPGTHIKLPLDTAARFVFQFAVAEGLCQFRFDHKERCTINRGWG
jgi:hypothetical protein